MLKLLLQTNWSLLNFENYEREEKLTADVEAVRDNKNPWSNFGWIKSNFTISLNYKLKLKSFVATKLK